MSNINSMIDQIVEAETAAEIDYLQERIEAEIDEQSEVGSYPRYGYTTSQIFLSAEGWADWKRSELVEAVAEARKRLENMSSKIQIMTVEHATGESARGYYGHTFDTVAEAIEYLKRNGGGTIEIEEVDSAEGEPSAQILTEDYSGEMLIIVEAE